MADAVATPAVTVSGVEDQTPTATKGFGAREYADTRRQASMQMAADEPEDVNFNAIVARSQALTIDALGKSFTANEDFRQKMQDRYLSKVT